MRHWRRVFAHVAMISARDLLRTPMTTISMATVFVVFLAIQLLLQWSVESRGGDVDLLGADLGIVFMAGCCAVALVGTSVPLVAMRERGTLRAFATVPMPRSAFLLGMLPVRVAIVLLEMAVVLVVAGARGHLDGAPLARFAATATIGAAMLFAVALLVASRGRSAEATQQSMAMVSILVVFASGGLVPDEIVPGWAVAAMRALPTTWFAEAAAADLAGDPAFAPVPVLWAGMALVAVAASATAVRRFDWDSRGRARRPNEREKTHA